MRHWRRALIIGLLTAALSIVGRGSPPASAIDLLCFEATDITNCIGGGFRAYWEQNGGLATFGYPLTAEFSEPTPDGTYTTQYFERARFEYHPENPLEYQVQLGRLGAELYSSILPIPDFPQPGCRYFPETGYNLCEPFFTKWSSVGDKPGAGNLELYGLPISPLQLKSDANGNTISVQWFERARFELHNSNEILLGLLGREILAEGELPAPTPEPFPQPTPEPLPEPTPALPEPIEAPFPNRPCHVNVPVPVAGIQAWATLPEVGPPYDEVICVRLIVDGAPAAYTAFVNIYRHNPDGRVIPGIGHTTGGDGTTGFIFYVGDLPINATVPVEVIATFEGREYRTWTSFIRR